MKKAVQDNITKTFKNLIEAVSSFSEDEINLVPFKASWTAGQVVQHLILACTGYPQIFAGNTKETTREPDEKIKDLEAVFLNFNIKMNSPDFIKPEITNYDKKSLLVSLLKIESDLLNSCEMYDLSLTCLDFQLPNSEKFTIYEWIGFALIHIQRHTKQLHTIFDVLHGKANKTT